MKFETINDSTYGARDAGYILDPSSPREYDNDLMERLKKTRGAGYVENLFDVFCDFDRGIYKGDDGQCYTVMETYIDGRFTPVIWQRICLKQK